MWLSLYMHLYVMCCIFSIHLAEWHCNTGKNYYDYEFYKSEFCKLIFHRLLILLEVMEHGRCWRYGGWYLILSISIIMSFSLQDIGFNSIEYQRLINLNWLLVCHLWASIRFYWYNHIGGLSWSIVRLFRSLLLH